MTDAVVDVAAGILCRHGRVLVCQRSFSGRHPGKFEFPGGKREGLETLEQCLRRELHEELGVVVEVGELLWTAEHQYSATPKVKLSFFAARQLQGEIVNRVFASVCWVEVDQLPTLDFLEADRELIDRLVDGSIRLPE